MTDFAAGIEEARALRDRGLMYLNIVSGQEPKVVPKDFLIVLPDNFGVENHGYGRPEVFIAYLRQVNNIPQEATEELQRLDGGYPLNARVRVLFKWWEIELVTDERWRIRD